MLWPVRFAVILMWRLRLILLSVLAGVGVGSYLQVREQQRTWGVVPADATRSLPGDGLVEPADVVDTRSLDIDAPPSAVWPWLVQMGWGRGGWYSYDRLDMDGQSADTILEDFQQLAVGDILPTYPGGGFQARVVEPDRALVLYLDSAMIRQQAEDYAAEQGEEPQVGEALPGGLQAAGFLGETAMPDFSATWAFLLDPRPGDRTRLIERFRVRAPERGVSQRLGMPMMGLGFFLMTRKHMLGIKERVERRAKA